MKIQCNEHHNVTQHKSPFKVNNKISILTTGPVVQLCAFKGLTHHGQFTPLVHSCHGLSPQLFEGSLQSPLMSRQNGEMHSHSHKAWLNMPLEQPAVGMSQTNPSIWPWARPMVAAARRRRRCFMVYVYGTGYGVAVVVSLE